MYRHVEANLLALIDSSEDMWGSVDLDHRMVVFNKNFQDYIQSCFGVEVEVGMNPAEILPPERAAIWPALYDRALTEGPYHFERTLTNGHILEIAFNPILVDGQPVGVSLYGRDITDRKHTEELLRDSEARYRAAFQTCADCFVIIRIDDGRFVDINQAFIETMGFEREEVIGRTTVELDIWVNP
jgi:PAS domain S-box-containing protein